ncbi:MAG: hypothetical protein M3Y80_09145 [Verrucomicrobiota bacterium]|nr:hypothetical protein [Verrucomicrobiota bacterium]
MRRLLCTLLAIAALPAVDARAGARRFTYLYETTTAAPGAFELESWATWERERESGRKYNRFDFRHEVEFGITDRLQAAVYVADWTYRTRGAGDERGANYTGSAIELIYNLTNPQTSALGSAIYGELKLGDDLVKLESKLLLDKNFGPLVFAYNAGLEAEWEGRDLDERTGEFQQTLGASYQIRPQFLIGAELLHEVKFEDWRDAQPHFVGAGPNVSVRFGNWWATTTALAQLTSRSGEPNFQVRTIVGYSF